MADKHFLDYDGLSQFFNGLKQKFYQKPSGGIPKTDLASSVQTSLGKADNALQSHQDISGKLDKSGGTMSGALNMGSKKITNLATPTNNTDAATKKYVDDKSHTHLNKELLDTIDMDSVRAWTTALSVDGGVMNGDLDMTTNEIVFTYSDNAISRITPGGSLDTDPILVLNGTKINSRSESSEEVDVILRGVATPTADTDAVNKAYVDSQISQTGHGHSNKTVLDGITSSKVSSWDAKASTSYVDTAVSSKASTSYVDNAISTAVASAVVYKGTKAAVANLPSTGNKTGDMWNVSADGMNYVWDGTKWDAQAPTFSVTAITNAEITAILDGTS